MKTFQNGMKIIFFKRIINQRGQWIWYILMTTSIRYNKTERDRRHLSWERSSMADRRRRNWGRLSKEPGEPVVTDFWRIWKKVSQSYGTTMAELIDDDNGSRGRRKRVMTKLITVRWRRWRRRRWLIVNSIFFLFFN